jgi:hypothetical protein
MWWLGGLPLCRTKTHGADPSVGLRRKLANRVCVQARAPGQREVRSAQAGLTSRGVFRGGLPYFHSPSGTAMHGFPLCDTVFVVAEPRFVVREEHRAAAAHPGLVEDALQVLLHGVRGHDQFARDPRGRALRGMSGR